MTLTELLAAVETAIERAGEHGEDASRIDVTVQIDDAAGNSTWGDRDVMLCYDGNGMASGCVISASKTGNS